MTFRQRSIRTLIVEIILTCFIVLPGSSRLLAASHLLPHVTPMMEKPEFWIQKIHSPSRVLWKPEEIEKINEKASRNQDLYLFSVKDLKDQWTKEEILAFFREDWEGFGSIDQGRYDRYGNPLKESFWIEVKKNLNEESLEEKNRMLSGLVVKRTDIRFFPTREICASNPTNGGFDQFQHSSVSPGSLVGVYHVSKDSLWTYVQTRFVRGWVQRADLAIAYEKSEALAYDEAKERLVVTGNFINVFSDPSFEQIAFSAQMGTSFPLLYLPGLEGGTKNSYVIRIPFREADGRLTFHKGYIPRDKDVHSGFLPYTQMNLAREVFKMLHQPYGWGEMSGARDCSRLIMDLFSAFGILMPRNSKFQARMGIDLGQVENRTSKEKERILDQAVPFATLLRLPGHIMLYLGKHRGRHYVIHNIWGIQETGESGPVLKKIGGVVVSDLNLGASGPKGSLLDRITDIRLIGSYP